MHMKPITVTKVIERPIAEVYEHLATLGNHEAFTDHMLVDWSLSGPAAGVGAIADVTSTLGARKEPVRFEVIEAEPPTRILERSTAAKGKRVATGEFRLAERGPDRTEVAFTFTLESAPRLEQLVLPLMSGKLRRANQTSLDRLAEQLTTGARSTS
jgi:carbon monoxide dehydrogenase subunit G